jgi:hypothetical protein
MALKANCHFKARALVLCAGLMMIYSDSNRNLFVTDFKEFKKIWFYPTGMAYSIFQVKSVVVRLQVAAMLL